MRPIESLANTSFVKIFQAAEKYEFLRWAGFGAVIAIIVYTPFVLLHH